MLAISKKRKKRPFSDQNINFSCYLLVYINTSSPNLTGHALELTCNRRHTLLFLKVMTSLLPETLCSLLFCKFPKWKQPPLQLEK